MIVDETFHYESQGCYELTRIAHLDGLVLRVHIRRDSYPVQSSARVEVLTPQRTWTLIATAPPSQWYHRTPLVTRDPATLQPVADQLIERARRILTPPSPPAADADRPAAGGRR